MFAVAGLPIAYLLLFASTQASFIVIFTAVVLLVPSHAAAVRAASVAVLTIVTYLLREAFAGICGNVGFRTLATSMFFLQLLSASDILCFCKVDSASFRPDSGAAEPSTAYVATGALGLLCNARRVGTKWQVANLVPIPKSESQRVGFVLIRLAKAFVTYLILDILASGPPADPVLVAHGKDTLVNLRSLTSQDVGFRVLGTVMFWLTMFLGLTCESNILFSFLVATGLSRPEDAPQGFGTVSQAYTIRNFWSKFWHQWFRRGYSVHADFVADTVFGLRRGTLLSRYMRIFLTFALSGVYHHVADLTIGIPSAQAGSMKFFLLQPLGILLEDLFQHLLASRIQNARLRRVIGYLWVLVFFAWSTPVWFFASARYGPKRRDLMLPVRILGHVYGE